MVRLLVKLNEMTYLKVLAGQIEASSPLNYPIWNNLEVMRRDGDGK